MANQPAQPTTMPQTLADDMQDLTIKNTNHGTCRQHEREKTQSPHEFDTSPSMSRQTDDKKKNTQRCASPESPTTPTLPGVKVPDKHSVIPYHIQESGIIMEADDANDKNANGSPTLHFPRQAAALGFDSGKRGPDSVPLWQDWANSCAGSVPIDPAKEHEQLASQFGGQTAPTVADQHVFANQYRI